MWCPSCQADVAAELSADDRRLNCARCGIELGRSAATIQPRSLHAGGDSTRDATELLARWTAEDLTTPRPVVLSTTRDPHQTPALQIAASSDATTVDATTVTESTSETVPVHVSSPGKSAQRRERSEPLSNWVAVAGQMAAYLGVLLLTCGTALVVVSQFGGTMQQAITGWFMTTIGQMLLFVGVVTLVSHGLDQNRREIAVQLKQFRRILRRHRAEAVAESERRAA